MQFENDYAEGSIELDTSSKYFTDKKANAQFWDEIESHVEAAFLNVAAAGGISIDELYDMTDIKELTQEMINRIAREFPQAQWPYVDEDL